MSDYSPPYTEEDAKFEKREEYLRKRIRELSLSDLTVDEMLDIIRVMQHTFSKDNAKTLERILNVKTQNR